MLTIGIPAYNEEKSIKNTILNILPQINKNDELLIVASGCTDNTVNIVKSINNKRIKIITQSERRGKVSGTNIILANAKGEIIILIDADVIISKESIKKIVSNFDDPQVGASCARVANFQKITLFDKIQGLGWEGLDQQKREENKKGTFYALNGYLQAIKNGIVNQLDEKYLLDDALLGWEIKNKGYKIIYDYEICAYVKAAQNLKDYIAQKSRNRVGWWQMTKKGMKIKERRNFKQLKYLFKSPYAWLYVSLDILIWIKAYIDFHLGKSYWQEIKSSKI